SRRRRHRPCAHRRAALAEPHQSIARELELRRPLLARDEHFDGAILGAAGRRPGSRWVGPGTTRASTGEAVRVGEERARRAERSEGYAREQLRAPPTDHPSMLADPSRRNRAGDRTVAVMRAPRIADRNMWVIYAAILLLGIAYGVSIAVLAIHLDAH